MKKVVIAASVSLTENIILWKNKFEDKGYEVINYPEKIQGNIGDQYQSVFAEFFRAIEDCDIFFVLNEDRKEISGYIGAETFAELCYAIAQNLLHDKKIEILILKIPSKEVQCFDEISLWIKNGMVKTIDI